MIIAFGSHSPSLMEKEKAIAIAQIDLDHNKDTKYGLINYADRAVVVSPLGELTTRDQVKKAIRGIYQTGQGTGLKDTSFKAFSQFLANGRYDARKIFMVFITQPSSAREEELQEVTRFLNGLNVRVMPVVIGTGADDDEINILVNDPKDVTKIKIDENDDDSAKKITRNINRGKICRTAATQCYTRVKTLKLIMLDIKLDHG